MSMILSSMLLLTLIGGILTNKNGDIPIHDTSNKPVEEVVEDTIKSYKGTISDEYNVPSEVMNVIINYMDNYYSSLAKLELQDMSSLFNNPLALEISNRAIDLLINTRKLYDFDFSFNNAHYDLKVTDYSTSGNIYKVSLLEDKNKEHPVIKLIDWGGARYFSKHKKMSKVNGTPYYIAPEVLNEVYDEKCDIWSAGVILYILLCGYPPFNGETDKEIMDAVKKGEFDFPEEEWDVITEEGKDLIKKMLTYDPKKRFSANQVLQHPWFNTFKGKNKANKKIAQSALDNMKRFKRNKQFEQATISFIINQLITKEERTELMKQFTEWDKNGDGVLSKEEILEGYRNAYGSADPDEVDNMIKSVDLDGNGVIDYNEFLNCTMNRDKIISKKNLELAFQAFDKDNSGAISIDEIMLIFKKTNNDVDIKIFENMIKEADINGDGEIEFDEFKDIMEKFFK